MLCIVKSSKTCNKRVHSKQLAILLVGYIFASRLFATLRRQNNRVLLIVSLQPSPWAFPLDPLPARLLVKSGRVFLGDVATEG